MLVNEYSVSGQPQGRKNLIMRTTMITLLTPAILRMLKKATITVTTLFCLFAFSHSLSAASYQTIAAGDWNDGSIWQGGNAPDPESLDGDDVVLSHDVTVASNNVKLSNGATLSANGVSFTLNGGNLIIEDGSVTFEACTIEVAHGYNIEQKTAAANLTIRNSQVHVGQNFQNSEGVRFLENVCLVVDENYQNTKGVDVLINVSAVIGNDSSGNFQNDSGSTMDITNSKFNLPNGNFQN